MVNVTSTSATALAETSQLDHSTSSKGSVKPAQAQSQSSETENGNGHENGNGDAVNGSTADGQAGVSATEAEAPSSQEQAPAQVEENGNGNDRVTIVQRLHRFCVEGDVMGVRGILSQNLELLETLDPSTNYTPMLSAIYSSQPDVVRELLLAGAYPPPPSVTSDPTILSLLYPSLPPPQPLPHMRFVPPPQSIQQSLPSPLTVSNSGIPAPFISHQQHRQSHDFSGFQQQQQPGHGLGHAHRMSVGGLPGQQGLSQVKEGQLPPLEVAKSIPCRNFPNCRYGDACAFLHPQQAFYALPYPTNDFIAQPFVPNGQPGPMFYPMQNQGMQQPPFGQMNGHPRQFQNQQQHHLNNNTHHNQHQHHVQQQQHSQLSQQQQQQQHTSFPSSSAASSPFVPGSQSLPQGSNVSSTVQTPSLPLTSSVSPAGNNQPLPSPTAIAEGVEPTAADSSAVEGSEAKAAPAEASATAPDASTTGTEGIPSRPQVFTQQAPPFFPQNAHQGDFQFRNNHRNSLPAKRMSFSHAKGGPWGNSPGRTAVMGTWNDGLPPPCVFFQGNKCKNGEMCKFPHINAEGTDCRHPDVIAATMQPHVNNGIPHRQPRMGRASFGGNPFNHDHRQPFAVVPKPHGFPMKPVVSNTPAVAEVDGAAEAEVEKTEAATETEVKATESTDAVAEKPVSPIANGVKAAPRSASLAGTRSVPGSRSHSPAATPPAFRAPRNGRQPQVGNGPAARSASIPAAPIKTKQKVPNADDFPTLGGAPSTNGSDPSAATAWGAGKKTAAQIVSTPAPGSPKQAQDTATSSSEKVTEGNAPVKGESQGQGQGQDQKAGQQADSTTQLHIPSTNTANELASNGRRTTISAPGKVLVTGGYLVLDPAYSGTVIATSSRFYTSISNSPSSSTESVKRRKISVASPQFLAANWDYGLEVLQSSTPRSVKLVQSSKSLEVSGRNKFVELALQKTLDLVTAFIGVDGIEGVFEAEGDDLNITIAGDNDFYSQRKALADLSLPAISSSLQRIPPFNHIGTTLRDVHKTGMGSSAALMTSLVGALLIHFGIVSKSAFSKEQTAVGTDDSTARNPANSVKRDDLPLEGSIALDLVHNTAQFVHCLAQGKVGSGFDVSSAVYGSQIYRKFEASVIEGLMRDEGVSIQELKQSLMPSSTWTNTHSHVSLPPNLRLLLADVDAGSDTPSLVGKVLKWRKENPAQAESTWETIKSLNIEFTTLLHSLCEAASRNPEEYGRCLDRIVKGGKSQSDKGKIQTVMSDFTELRRVMKETRGQMKRMGVMAGVPIEPDEQTRLLDACSDISGVIGGGVPGAGGYDALFLLVIDTASPTSTTVSPIITSIETLWQSWSDLSLCPLSCRSDTGGLCFHGKLEDVSGLKGIVQ